MDIKTLRSSRNSIFSKITAEIEKEANPGSRNEDTRFWKLERDKAGNGTATIRFLNRTEGDELPWVKVFSHGFKGPSGRWYIEDSLTTIGKPDPVSELNMALWNSTTDDNSPERKQVREQKRRLNYIANILVVNDPKHPENNGKVFLFKFGKKIFDKIMDKARPAFEDQEPVNVFDYWEGANFKLRVKTVDKFPNYDASEFEPVSPVAETDEEILEIARSQYKLSEFIDPARFKSYDELKAKLDSVLNVSAPVAKPTAADDSDEDNLPWDDEPKPKAAKAAPVRARRPVNPIDDDDDDAALAYFQDLVNDD